MLVVARRFGLRSWLDVFWPVLVGPPNAAYSRGKRAEQREPDADEPCFLKLGFLPKVVNCSMPTRVQTRGTRGGRKPNPEPRHPEQCDSRARSHCRPHRGRGKERARSSARSSTGPSMPGLSHGRLPAFLGEYHSPYGGAKFLDGLVPSKSCARASNREESPRPCSAIAVISIISGQKQFSSGAVIEVNNKAKLTMRKSLWIRTFP